MGVYGVARLGSIHNTYNVPSEPERATKARRAVVASYLNSITISVQIDLGKDGQPGSDLRGARLRPLQPTN